MNELTIVRAAEANLDDRALEALLYECYVPAGFTAPDVAQKLFTAEAVRARGELFVAVLDARLVGVIICVLASSASRRLALDSEAELHLLGVAADARGHGVGAALVARAVACARENGASGIVLWTQPGMLAAQQLYAKAGFERRPAQDFERDGKRFLVYRRLLG
jgi:GNAT superfamily N-acetyltransferase